MIMKNLTFGKYKNQAINEIFKKIKNYIEWLCKQSWFVDRHKELYNQCILETENYNPICYEDSSLCILMEHVQIMVIQMQYHLLEYIFR